jgi:hypothetical protein
MDSISLVWISGTGFVTPAAASDGLGSFTYLTILVIVGRMFIVTASASLIWGVTFMRKPTETSFGVVVKFVVEIP